MSIENPTMKHFVFECNHVNTNTESGVPLSEKVSVQFTFKQDGTLYDLLDQFEKFVKGCGYKEMDNKYIELHNK